ncbi:MAG: GntR family transcriptional regulator [Pseudomonadota bacterium]
MDVLTGIVDRRTSADVVFDHLYDQIVRLELLPGTKMSEIEVAKRFGLSRQPVRDAFSRLSNLGLLLQRPQRSTIVRHFSLEVIRSARFVRTAVEVEVLRNAALSRDESVDAEIDANLDRQLRVIDANDVEAFHQADYEFHALMCRSARSAFAFDAIAENKAKVDRLCMLSLTSQDAMRALYDDHREIVSGQRRNAPDAVETAIRRHLDRLTPVIAQIHAEHGDYFED